MKRKVDFNSVSRAMKSQQNISTHRKLVCVVSVKHNSVIRIPNEDYKDSEAVKQKGGHNLVYPIVREFKDAAGKLHTEREKSKEWFYCEKSLYKRFKSGEQLSFEIKKDGKVVGIKNVIV